jgi:hypothetical protein
MRSHTSRRVRSGSIAALRAGVDAIPARCFADDVIVDFPSVEPALDRMRRAFLAEDRLVPLSTAIRLSTRDAIEGVRLPLSVPVRRTCRGCGGRGESWTECCRACDGSGAELLCCELEVTVPAGVRDGTRVEFTLDGPHSLPTRVELRIAID